MNYYYFELYESKVGREKKAVQYENYELLLTVTINWLWDKREPMITDVKPAALKYPTQMYSFNIHKREFVSNGWGDKFSK